MFIRKYWVPITIFIVVLLSCSLILLLPREKPPIKIYKPVETEQPTAKAPVGDTSQGGHWHGDQWHAEPHETPAADETPRSQPRQRPETRLDAQASIPVPPEAAYQALREKYPEQTNNPSPFENVPVDLWDFEATKKAFMDHFNFYMEHYDPKEGWSHTRELRIAAAVMTNIDNAAKPWFGLFTPEQCKEINALHQRYFDFKGVKVNHDRVWDLVHNEGYSVSEALDISSEEDSNR